MDLNGALNNRKNRKNRKNRRNNGMQRPKSITREDFLTTVVLGGIETIDLRCSRKTL